MNSQQESMQKALREEQDARFQNQGEVSILRKRMEKVCVEIKCDYTPLLQRDLDLCFVCIAYGGTQHEYETPQSC